jgi:hypothetical protein
MRTAVVFTFFGIILLLILWIQGSIITGPNTIDIHVHDTKLVIRSNQVLIKSFVVLFLFLGTLFTFGGIIGTRLTKKAFLIAFAVFFILDFSCLIYITRLFK